MFTVNGHMLFCGFFLGGHTCVDVNEMFDGHVFVGWFWFWFGTSLEPSLAILVMERSSARVFNSLCRGRKCAD